MSGEINTLISIVDKWIERVFYGKKRENEQRDKNLLQAAAHLHGTLRGLDDHYRKLLGQLRIFDLDWEADKRQQIIEQINRFADQEKILPAIEIYIARLTEKQDNSDPTVNPIIKLLSCGRAILVAAGESPVTPFHDFDELRIFLKEIKSANNQEDVESVIKTTSKMIDVFNRKILRDADRAMGDLLKVLQERHPFLPVEDYPIFLNQATKDET